MAGAWGPPGGARDSHETELESEPSARPRRKCGLDPAGVRVHGVFTDDHGGWSYRTVLANAGGLLAAAAISEETREVAWVPVEAVELAEVASGICRAMGPHCGRHSCR